MLAAQTSAMASSTHLKSEWIMKLTAAIHPIESPPAIPAPAAATDRWSRKDVHASVSARPPVAAT